MKKFKQSKYRRGITLIELIVTIAIFSILIVAITNLFLFNNKVYSRGEKLTQVQFDVRMASDFVKIELRNKNIVSTTDNTLTNSIDVTTLQDKYSSIKTIDFEIIKKDDDYFIEYTISGSDTNNNNPYTLNTEILLNNITIADETSGSSIYYE